MSTGSELSDRPQVAVLMCVHRGADPAQFDESLASMRAQTHRALRLFVYCDGPLRAEHEQALARHLHTDGGVDRIVRGERPAGLSPPAVLDYIEANGLYRRPQGT